MPRGPGSSAGTKYFNGNPNLTAYIAGTDQYTVGSEIDSTGSYRK